MDEVKHPADGSEPTEAPEAYVDAIMQREAQRAVEAATPPKRRKNRTPILIVLGALLIVLTARNITQWSREPDAATLRRELEATLYESMLYVIDEVESYRDSTGVLPSNLVDLGVVEEHIRYRREDDTYLLRTAEGLPSIVYRGGKDITPLEAASAALWQEIQ